MVPYSSSKNQNYLIICFLYFVHLHWLIYLLSIFTITMTMAFLPSTIIPGYDAFPLEIAVEETPHLLRNYSASAILKKHRRKRSGLIDDVLKNEIECEPLDAPKDEKGEPKMFVCKKRLSWKEAHTACEETVGHLASLLTRTEAEELVESIFAKSFFDEEYDWGRKTHVWGLDRRYWIGLTDIMQEGQWAWVGKGKTLNYRTMWYPSQPDHVDFQGNSKGSRRQHCVSLWNPAYYKVDEKGKPYERHTFDDLECERQLYFICEHDPAKKRPTPNPKSPISSPSGRGAILTVEKAKEELAKATELLAKAEKVKSAANTEKTAADEKLESAKKAAKIAKEAHEATPTDEAKKKAAAETAEAVIVATKEATEKATAATVAEEEVKVAKVLKDIAEGKLKEAEKEEEKNKAG